MKKRQIYRQRQARERKKYRKRERERKIEEEFLFCKTNEVSKPIRQV